MKTKQLKLTNEERSVILKEKISQINSGLYGYDRGMNLVLLSENPKAVPAKVII